jgi:D-alanyl-D-alanine carboxypeptidase (penicillin-binding protein 5/6)
MSRVLIAIVALAVLAVAYVVVQMTRPLPALAVTVTSRHSGVLPGTPPRPAWPSGAEAAVGIPGIGLAAGHGGNQEQAIASLAKMMTADIVLHDHPLQPGANGPTLTVSSADVAVYQADEKSGDSVTKVTAGEKLTERQALEALLLPSGDNIASMLAQWDAGSEQAFVAKMNGQARALGLSRTHYADASGVSPATVSTARDQLVLALHDMQIRAFRHIVAMPQATLPVAGTVYNVNYGLGHEGIVGIKTGSTPQAGGCLAFASSQTVNGRPVTLVGVVLGVQPTKAQPSELTGAISDSETLINSLSGSLTSIDIVTAGNTMGRVAGGWTTGTALVTRQTVAVTGWPGIPFTTTVTTKKLADSAAAGQQVGTATISIGDQKTTAGLVTKTAVHPPSLTWRLTRV